METMSSVPASRVASTYGSRPTSPYTHSRGPNPIYAPVGGGSQSTTGNYSSSTTAAAATGGHNNPLINITNVNGYTDPLYATRGQVNGHSSDIF